VAYFFLDYSVLNDLSLPPPPLRSFDSFIFAHEWMYGQKCRNWQ